MLLISVAISTFGYRTCAVLLLSRHLAIRHCALLLLSDIKANMVPALIEYKEQQALLMHEDSKPVVSSALHALLQPGGYQLGIGGHGQMALHRHSLSMESSYLHPVPSSEGLINHQHHQHIPAVPVTGSAMTSLAFTSLQPNMTSHHSNLTSLHVPTTAETLGMQDQSCTALLSNTPFAAPSPPKAIPVMVEQATLNGETPTVVAPPIKTEMAALTPVSAT